MRRFARLALPVVVGIAVAAVATTSPASAVHGDLATGPRPPAAIAPSPLAHDFRVGWTDRHAEIRLRIRDGVACRPGRPVETSTAPARIEVTVARPSGSRCAARQRWWSDDLRRPAVAERGQAVSVWVDGTRGEVRRYRA
jgi:hypothetical protein